MEVYVFKENNQRDYLVQHWAAVGLDLSVPEMLVIGWFEIALGVFAFFKPLQPLLIFIVIWKVFCELLYPISGVPNPYIWEFLERFGDYTAPLALILLLNWKKYYQSREAGGN